MPDWIVNAPELLLGLELYWVAFQELNTCRPEGVAGPRPIPWIAALEYARFHGFDEEQVDRLWYFTRKLDEALIRWSQSRGDQQDPRRIQQKNAGGSPWSRR